MRAIELLIDALGQGRVLNNYIIPGLRSTELGRSANGGMMRMFEMMRDQEYEVTPHDHRFGFNCYVLEGKVVNRVYRVSPCEPKSATHVIAPYDATTHSLNLASARSASCGYEEHVYGTGEWYSMSHDQFHSIRFQRGSRILFIEGPAEKSLSSCLLPFSNGKICDTFLWRDWMMEE